MGRQDQATRAAGADAVVRARILSRQLPSGLPPEVALGAGDRPAELGADQVAGLVCRALPAAARPQGRGDVVHQHPGLHPGGAVHRLSRRSIDRLVGRVLPIDVWRVLFLANADLCERVLPCDPRCAPGLLHHRPVRVGTWTDVIAPDGDRQLRQLHGGGAGLAPFPVVPVSWQAAGMGQDHARIPHGRAVGAQAPAPGGIAAIVAGGG